MKKFYLLAAVALVALASCTSDEFIGESPTAPSVGQEKGAIVFGTGVNTVTRSLTTGSDAATLLNNNFVFAGTKGDGTPTSFIFDQYTAHYVSNTANTTESNSNDWEYVGFMPYSTSVLPKDATTNNFTPQTIKYWDYSTTQYDFAAYSLGEGVDDDDDASTDNTFATPTAIAKGNKSYTLTGTADQLKACYISDLVTAYNRDGVTDYGKPVQFSFRSLAAKIRFAFYETVPGYSVKDVMFYASSAATSATDDPTLFVKTDDTFKGLPTGRGTMTITFPTTGWTNSPHGSNSADYNKAHISFAAASNSDDLSSTLVLEDLASFAAAEKLEDNTSAVYLGRASNTATYAGGLVGSPAAGKYYTVLPYEDGANLHLRIKYTLVSTDGSSETIDVDNATAVVPAELTKWNPNYAYTYIFKIGDMTNGTTGTDGNNNIITGLTPITLDAVVVDSEDGVQETITTVSTPSITTYAEGKVVTANDEYKKNIPIYVIVNNGTSNETLTDKANLYTVTLTAGTGAGASPSQPISEASVDNALANGVKDNETTPTTWTATDANKWDLVVTKSNLLSLVNVIDAVDSPTGNDITIGTEKVAKFTPTDAGTYAFQYLKEAAVAAADAVYTAVENGTTLTSGTTYYEYDNGYVAFVSDGTETANGTNYFVLTTPAVAAQPAKYQYKIIKVVD